jgi:hypothetical protein
VWLDLDLDIWGHNLGFDLHFLRENGYRLPPEDRWHDSLLVAHTAGRRRSGEASLTRLAIDAIKAGELPEAVLQPEANLKAWARAAARTAKVAGLRKPDTRGQRVAAGCSAVSLSDGIETWLRVVPG